MVMKNNTTAEPEPVLISIIKKFNVAIRKPGFARYYMFGSLVILLASTVFWSLMGARVHMGNADQLVNPYMFEANSTFSHALFPGQHTYLLKWPLFLIVHLFGETTNSYVVMTVAVALLTVSVFAKILYKIEHRPLIFGTLILALASALMLVPAQPYAGGLLPVSMAMIANRNLEYVFYIASLLAIIHASRLKSKLYIYGCIGLTLLIASDKLFMNISLGGATIALVCYAATQRWTLVMATMRWFQASVLATIGSVVLLGLISVTHITHISSQAAGPYGLISSIKPLVLALIYGILGIFTNFGANPAFNKTVFREMPHEGLHQLISLGGPSILLNSITLAAGLVVAYRILILSFGRHKISNFKIDRFYVLTLFMIWSTAAAFGAFIFTDHYYAGDARYVTVAVFSIFIALATYMRSRNKTLHRYVTLGFCFMVATALCVPLVTQANNRSIAADKEVITRNQLIAQAVTSHRVNTLLGDYWRVLPIRQASHGKINVTPLSSCTAVRDVLSSTKWQPDLQNNSFAYILSTDKNIAGYGSCTLDQVTNAYGKPNVSVVIAGSLEEPKEYLLFYDHGARKGTLAEGSASTLTSSTIPISLEELPSTVCSGPTIMNIVAHQDDDLLFMNPDTKHAIEAGSCVRTVYITAGDAGSSNQFYWLGREQGSQAAYSTMVGYDSIWVQRTVKTADNQYITVSNPKGNNKISLIYIRLPDGNLHGEGFGASNHESLQKLLSGNINSIHSIYGQSSFSKAGLIKTLASLMHIYQPAEIRSLSNYKNATEHVSDHSDHIASASFTDMAYKKFEKDQYNNTVIISFIHYMGYPISKLPENVPESTLDDKSNTFFAYATHDGAVCRDSEECSHAVYGLYLTRQYTAQ